MSIANRRGVWAEHRAAAWLIEQGYWVALAMGSHNAFDLVAVNDKGICTLWDVKLKWLHSGRVRTLEQKRMGVRLLFVALDGVVQPVKHVRAKRSRVRS